MANLFRRVGFRSGSDSDDDTPRGQSTVVIQDSGSGDLKFVGDIGGNTSEITYQEASGAPVEVKSPLGYAVGPVTILFLNISKMVGTGIFSTPASILTGTGSTGLSLIFWFIGFLTSLSSLSVYLEYSAYFPSRSGSEVAYLEQAYPRPKYFLPVTFAITTVLLSFSSGNAVVMAQYLFAIGDYSPKNWELKGLAIGCYTLAVLCVIFHTRASYILSNAIGAIKLITLVFIAITGLVVLGGHTSVPHPKANFQNAFEGTATVYGVTNAMYKIIFAYSGFENAFNVANEVKDPVRKIRNNGFGAVTIVAVLYMLANIAFFAAIPESEIVARKQIAAGLLFTKVFGSHASVRGLNFLIALSSFGNLVAVLLGQSRLIRECGRQGVLPYPKFWTSTKPFGTPIGPYVFKWVLTLILILAPPAGDAFNFTTDLAIYPASVFNLILAVGIYVLRWNRHKLNLPRPSFRAWDIVLVFNIIVQLYLIIMPWYPPAKGRFGGDVSFWYATYIVVGLCIIGACALYYVAWISILPKLGGYKIRQELIESDNGEKTHVLRKVPLARVEEWDRTHDANGHRLGNDAAWSEGGNGSNVGEYTTETKS